MYVFYSLLLAFAALLSLPWWTIQMVRLGKYRSGLAERLGFVPARLNNARPGWIWVHAVSVGEVLAVSQLVNDLKRKFPIGRFLSRPPLPQARHWHASASAKTGFSLCRYFGFAVRRYLKVLSLS